MTTSNWRPFGNSAGGFFSSSVTGNNVGVTSRPTDIAVATSCLAIINLLVVCGNVFVLYILISQKSLHTSTNFLVLSLTLSDFMLGVLILPFSLLQEYSLTWLFGDLWCKLWLALDVLLSTASIYNLLAISFDRYMAVRQPIKYRFISSNRMTKITIATVWLIASALALPSLIFDHFGITTTMSNKTFEKIKFISISSIPTTVGEQCSPVTSSNWYILFSAFVSFVLPMFLMVGLNFSIFYTVFDSTKNIKITENSTQLSNNFTQTVAAPCKDVNSLLRIHRGGQPYNNALSKNKILSCSQRSLNTIKKRSFVNFHHNTIDHSLFPLNRNPTFDTITVKNNSLDGQSDASIDLATVINNNYTKLKLTDTFSISLDSSTFTNNTGNDNSLIILKNASCVKLNWLNRIKAINREKRQQLIEAEQNSYQSTNSSNYQCNLSSYNVGSNGEKVCTSSNSCIQPSIKMKENFSLITSKANCRPSLMTIVKSAVNQCVLYPAIVTTFLAAKNSNETSNRKTVLQTGSLFVYAVVQHYQQKNLNRSSVLRTELRVARTIGVVVGCFIVCWLPFTIIYILQAYQICPVGICIPNWFFTLAFWLGYSNSALNPLLYAAFSRDFRSAFRRVLVYRTSSLRSK